jgi:type II secretory pathway pseudopilin PulG
MKRDLGFTFFEVLVVLLLLVILMTLSIITLVPHRKMVKTDDAANGVYALMRQARILAITRLQFYGVVINMSDSDQTIPLHNSTKLIKFPQKSVSLVDMGSITKKDDEEISLSKKLPIDVVLNADTGLPKKEAFPFPEQDFPKHDFNNSNPKNSFVCYFDPAGRVVNRADGSGFQEYRTFFFSSYDITVTKSPTLLRAITLYGATGGLRFWRYTIGQTDQWVTKISQ